MLTENRKFLSRISMRYHAERDTDIIYHFCPSVCLCHVVVLCLNECTYRQNFNDLQCSGIILSAYVA